MGSRCALTRWAEDWTTATGRKGATAAPPHALGAGDMVDLKRKEMTFLGYGGCRWRHERGQQGVRGSKPATMCRFNPALDGEAVDNLDDYFKTIYNKRGFITNFPMIVEEEVQVDL
ncbi:unnamed protein product [Urochloa humidicola]